MFISYKYPEINTKSPIYKRLDDLIFKCSVFLGAGQFKLVLSEMNLTSKNFEVNWLTLKGI